MTTAPVFAVVGHPNKGKSTLVSSLAQDPSVGIGQQPGTTHVARAFPMRVDAKLLYTLVDTPGFQRPRAVLQALQASEVSAAERPQAVAQFVRQHIDDAKFKAECELLGPIIDGAGILYVVDGSVPYAAEYEAEMEILRWSGQPSIALINSIGEAQYVEDWSRALAQYFRVVRVLDALQAPFEQRLQVLSAFAELDEAWREPMNRALQAMRDARQQALQNSANSIANLLRYALTLQVEKRTARDSDPQPLRRRLEQDYQSSLRRLEQNCRKEVQRFYHHESIERHEAELEAIDEDLFSQDTWLLFGLERKDLARAGVAAGALTGLGVDALTGGGSMFLGTALGAAIGGVSSWFSVDALAELRIEKLAVGGRIARFGPSRNANLPFVLFGRARIHHQLISGRSHAQRTALELPTQGSLNIITDEQRNHLASLFAKLRKHKPGGSHSEQALDELCELMAEIL